MIKLQVKRTDLIKAIEDKAAANQKAYDAKVEEAESNSGVAAAIDKAIDARFGPKSVDGSLSPDGAYYKSTVKMTRNTMLSQLGLSTGVTSIPLPLLYGKQLAALRLAQDDVLEIEDTNDYFGFLA